MQFLKKQKLLSVFVASLIFACAVWFVPLVYPKNSGLRISFLNIGQGDAIFIESPSGNQMLVDAGPRGKIMPALSKVMPIYDKTIDAIMITNPDADHIGGFLDVLKNYEVGYVFEPGTFNKSKTYEDLEKQIKEKNIKKFVVRKGMVINLGAGSKMDIIFPDRDVSSFSPNDGSIVGKVIYGKNSVMLTGDATQKTEKMILGNNLATSLKSDILKVGHHGSRTSTSSEFVSAVSPEYAVISDGKSNKYGHPHKETLDTLKKYRVKVLRTDLLGTIIFGSDGERIVQVK